LGHFRAKASIIACPWPSYEFEPGEKHQHGASPEKAMSHIGIQEEVNGKSVEWMEKVTDEQYQK